MTTFTASEVRDRAQWLKSNGFITEPFMLYAYADRLEADEKAVPVATVKDSDALYTGWLSWTGESLLPETPLYTHPAPADAERLAEALRIAKPYVATHPDVFDLRERDGHVQMIEEALAAHPTQAQPPAASVTDEMVERARSAFVRADDGSTGITDAIRAALLAAQENPNA